MNVVYHEELSAPAAITGPVHEKQFIAIHWYGDPATSGDVHGTARYLAGVTHASVNYVAGDGHVYCLINPTQVAYAQGDGSIGYGNLFGISIECDPRASAATLETVAQLIAKIRKDFGVNFPLRPHQDFTRTACPGVYVGKLAWLDQRARQIATGQGAAPAPAPAPVKVVPVASTNTVELRRHSPKVLGLSIGAGAYQHDSHWRVDSGDTLSAVAAHFGATVDQVKVFNGIADASQIFVNERIWSPKAGYADTWLMEPGETLSGIVEFYKKNGHAVSVEQLKNANGINDPSKIPVGLRLIVP